MPTLLRESEIHDVLKKISEHMAEGEFGKLNVVDEESHYTVFLGHDRIEWIDWMEPDPPGWITKISW